MKQVNLQDPHVVRIGVTTVLNILAKWQCSKQQVRCLLLLPAGSEFQDIESMIFSHEQQERVSYILNIHAGLRTVFNNPKNIYGFMNMSNHNSPFNGEKPIDFLTNGENAEFEPVISSIDSLGIPK
ncbi:hypothetical protein L2729_00550 [Shewanella gelidimarina]|uniref:hypothetical protein n=1 Tax=Shewanella gelidimarina TaxID=56813 RepID=UPI00200E36AA|nr:hypothetical protein [Shewanella gelidimarina]MCL1056479.1 hypothetical protein [Shewanella gelidimarina]